MKYKAIIDNFNQASLHSPSKETIQKYLHIDEIKEEDAFGNLMIRPLFSHSSINDLLETEVVDIKDIDDTCNYIYPVMLHHNAELAVSHLNLIDPRIIEKIKNKTCKLILDNTLEGDTIERFLPILLNSIKNLKLPYEQIYFITNNLKAEEYFKEWVNSSKIFINSFKLQDIEVLSDITKDRFYHNSINVISFPWNIHDVKRLTHLKHLPESINIEKEIEYKQNNLVNIKPFLKVNRTGRPERSLIMLYLNYYNLLSKFKISFPRLDHLDDFEALIHQKFPEVISQDNINSLKNKIPFDIDKSDIDNHGQPGIGKGKFNADLPFDPLHYRNTFLSIVMCAFPHTENACHLHSSTFNPIYCGHPYIGFGPFNHLANLKKLGFRTFNKWWDEGYDNFTHHLDRLEHIIKLIEKLSKYSNSDFLEMYKEMKHTLQYNSNLIKKFNGKEELTRKIF